MLACFGSIYNEKLCLTLCATFCSEWKAALLHDK